MIYAGIDIAKRSHFASAISSDSVELMKPFKFTNDGNNLQLLHSRPIEFSYSDDSIISLEEICSWSSCIKNAGHTPREINVRPQQLNFLYFYNTSSSSLKKKISFSSNFSTNLSNTF